MEFALKGVCRKTLLVRKPCEKLLDKYLSQLTDLIVKSVPYGQICGKIRLCASEFGNFIN